jgi:hypothetical protein
MNPRSLLAGASARVALALLATVSVVAIGAGLAHARKADAPAVAAAVPGALVAPGPVSVSDPPLDAKSKTFEIDGAVGGSCKHGRFQVTVPAGAWRGTASITISVPDQTKLACDLTISPATANGFAVPVVLTMKTKGCDPAVPLTAGYFDPVSGKWTEVPGAYQDAVSKNVIVPLYHFSRYGALDGRAGW